MSLVVALATLGISSASTPGADAAPPPTPLPWERTYVLEAPQTAGEIGFEIFGACISAPVNGALEGTTAGPHYAVIGDSIAAQYRLALYDEIYHFAFAATCGERFGSTLDSGRAAAALATDPSVLVLDLGYNTFLDGLQNLHPELIPAGLLDLDRLLQATDHLPCRVIVNIARQPDPLDTPAQAAIRLAAIDQVNAALAAAAARPGVHLVDWNAITASDPAAFMIDGRHILRHGINVRLNKIIETGRQCLPPDSPATVSVAGGEGSATVSWSPLPAPEHVSGYRVRTNTGLDFTTTNTTLTVSGLPPGQAVRFDVAAINAAGEGEPSAWSEPVYPTALHGDLAGTVVNRLGQPLPGMLALATPADHLELAGMAFTDGSGAFTFPDLPIGQYKVAIVDTFDDGVDFYEPEVYNNVPATLEALGDAPAITVTGGLTTHLDPIQLEYNHPGSITGTISSADGPLGGMLALLVPADEIRLVGVGISAPDGTFTIPDLLPGSYRLVAIDPALASGAESYYLPEIYDDAGATLDALQNAPTIEVSPSGVVTLHPIVLDHTP